MNDERTRYYEYGAGEWDDAQGRWVVDDRTIALDHWRVRAPGVLVERVAPDGDWHPWVYERRGWKGDGA